MFHKCHCGFLESVFNDASPFYWTLPNSRDNICCMVMASKLLKMELHQRVSIKWIWFLINTWNNNILWCCLPEILKKSWNLRIEKTKDIKFNIYKQANWGTKKCHTANRKQSLKPSPGSLAQEPRDVWPECIFFSFILR